MGKLNSVAGGKIANATVWLIVASVLSQTLRLVSNLILARLLVPEYFGVMSIVILVWTGLNLLTDAGLQQSVVRAPENKIQKMLPTIFFVQLIRGIFISIFLFFLTFLASYYSSANVLSNTIYALPEFSLAMFVISFVPVIAGIQSVGLYVFQKKFKQKELFYVEFSSQFLGFICAIVLYFIYGPSILVLSGSAVASIFFKTVISYIVTSVYVYPKASKAYLVEVWDFGKWIVLSSVMGFLLISSDRFLLSVVIDPELLGVYAIAAFILISLKEVVSKFFIRVYFSALSHYVNSGKDVVAYYAKTKVKIDSILIFVSVVLFWSAESFIQLMYDERYVYAGYILSVLSLGIIGKSSEVFLQYLLVIGNSRSVALYNAVTVTCCYLVYALVLFYAGFEFFLLCVVFVEFCRFLSSIFLEYIFLNDFFVSLKKYFFALALGSGFGFFISFVFSLLSEVVYV